MIVLMFLIHLLSYEFGSDKNELKFFNNFIDYLEAQIKKESLNVKIIYDQT